MTRKDQERIAKTGTIPYIMHLDNNLDFFYFSEVSDMYSASDLRKGLKVKIDGEPYIVTEFEFSKPGKGQALYRTKMRNMITGNQFTHTYRSNDKFEKPDLEERTMQFLYSQDDEFHFMDTSTYEQIFLTTEQMGDHISFLVDNMEVQVLFFGSKAIDISLPTFVNLEVTKADPWVKGDTSGTDTKPVTVETGYVLQVPPFIEEGDRIQIDTRTGQYITRVKE
jgi:elongation factor P